MRRASSGRCVTLINSQLKGRAVRSDAGVRAHLINYVAAADRSVLREARFLQMIAGARQEGVASRLLSRRVASCRERRPRRGTITRYGFADDVVVARGTARRDSPRSCRGEMRLASRRGDARRLDRMHNEHGDNSAQREPR